MAVVVAGELHDHVAAGEAAGQADGAHRRLRARTHHPYLLDRRNRRNDQVGEPALGLCRCAVARACGQRPLDRLHHPRMPVAEDHRPPGADVVEVDVAVDVGEVLAEGRREKDRLAPHPSERAGGRVDATGDQPAGPGEGVVALWPAGGGAFVGGRQWERHGDGVGGVRRERASATASVTCGREA